MCCFFHSAYQCALTANLKVSGIGKSLTFELKRAEDAIVARLQLVRIVRREFDALSGQQPLRTKRSFSHQSAFGIDDGCSAFGQSRLSAFVGDELGNAILALADAGVT